MSMTDVIRHATFRPVPLRSAWAALALAFEARRQRARLAELPRHMLDDIGITERERQSEAERPIWDVPSNWRR